MKKRKGYLRILLGLLIAALAFGVTPVMLHAELDDCICEGHCGPYFINLSCEACAVGLQVQQPDTWHPAQCTGAAVTLTENGALAYATNGGTITVTGCSVGPETNNTSIAAALAEIMAETPSDVRIGTGVFSNIMGLSIRTVPTELILPEGVTEIGDMAFANSRIKSVTIPASVTAIGENAFLDCQELGVVVIEDDIGNPSRLARIGNYAFNRCKLLTSINLPAGLPDTGIGEGVFADCEKLTIPNGWAIPDGWTTVPSRFLNGTNISGTVTIPASVTSIGEFAFCRTNISEVVFSGNTIMSIGKGAFENCPELTAVTNLPDSVTILNNYTFNDCKKLQSITLPSNLTTIGIAAFGNCERLSSLVFPEGLLTIGSSAFSSCTNLTAVNLPTTLTTIDSSAFAQSGLTEVVIPASVTTHGFSVFLRCKQLISATYADASTLSSIGSSSFNGCTALEQVVLPKGLTDIGMGTFAFCDALATIDLPQSITSIGKGAFNSSGLTSITIPPAVVSIGEQAFQYCSSLGTVNIEDISVLKTVQAGAFEKTALETIFLPDSVESMESESMDTPGTEVELFSYNGAGSSVKSTILACYDSYAAWWARENGYPYIIVPSQGDMRANPPSVLYKYIPYEFIIQTRVPNNDGLLFEITSGALPDGLKLVSGAGGADPNMPPGAVPGTIYGSPLNYEDFVGGVTFTVRATVADQLSNEFSATAEFTIYLADTPNNAFLEANVNDYSFATDPNSGLDGHIGIFDGALGHYVITNVAVDEVMYTTGEYALFDSFWIDGIKQIVTLQYHVEDGSTRVTILAQTIEELDDGEHTAAAAFRKAGGDESGTVNAYALWNDENGLDPALDVVAQNFIIHRSEPPEDPDDGSGGNTGDESGGQDGGSTDDESDGSSGNQPDDTSRQDGGNTGSESSELSGNQQNGGNNNGSGLNQPTFLPGGQTGGNVAPSAATDTAGTGGNPPAGGEASDNGANAGANGNGGAGDTVGANGTGTAGSSAATGEGGTEGAGGPSVSGLELDANGLPFFLWDGSTPLTIRIDIALDQFRSLLFDGQHWSADADFTVREGSTILSIPPERLKQVDAGKHTLSAQFVSETVEITFDLIKAAPDVDATDDSIFTEDGGNAPSGAPGWMTIGVAIAALLGVGSAVLAVMLRRRRGTP